MITALPRVTRIRGPALVLTGVAWIAFEEWARGTRATSDEKRKPLPGDELVARRGRGAQRA